MKDIAAEMKKIGFVIREDKQRNDLAVLNQTVAPALLFEIGLISSEVGNKFFDDKFNDIAEAFVRTIGDNCKLKNS